MTPNDSAMTYARNLADQEFWGFLTLKYEAGRIVHMRREENIKPTAMVALSEKNRGKFDTKQHNN